MNEHQKLEESLGSIGDINKSVNFLPKMRDLLLNTNEETVILGFNDLNTHEKITMR